MWVSVCLHAAYVLFLHRMCTYFACVCGCMTGSTGPVELGLIIESEVIFNTGWYEWIASIALPGGRITYHWAFLQPCCNVLATWYCCHNALTILFCHFVVCSVMIKGAYRTVKTIHFCISICMLVKLCFHAERKPLVRELCLNSFKDLCTHKPSKMLHGVSVSFGGPCASYK